MTKECRFYPSSIMVGRGRLLHRNQVANTKWQAKIRNVPIHQTLARLLIQDIQTVLDNPPYKGVEKKSDSVVPPIFESNTP